ncbi:hypothetical protein ACVIWV_002862 [Bradyrhizobium diazoefficiens]|jgi:hypothetical protein|uniref:Uncharacterized protein n=1 Tax=Bradyrhizobium diazoefficiens TaxID=1355477 RepID=A0A809ZLZ8_9BRAD|nr:MULTISPECIES: hypothetical protein [Bradyrhizobium]APO52714.1 gluconate 5-dehydrogenase [Bradyrhizobium diazoefficiens]MBR0868631.1 hypothetical protein [Bradyrhizobium diazoefficiens]MBR0893171.1 hypothetical protein [Bradyrhizobium diazoefficiens]MBR0924880.1 hypothetical protein [Bradyrhizobium diazoefficiens]MCD9294832.1 hypothetical protein [Bradyrhizobium diazoefficiens]
MHVDPLQIDVEDREISASFVMQALRMNSCTPGSANTHGMSYLSREKEVMELDFNSPLRGLAAQATRFPGGAKADIVGCPSWIESSGGRQVGSAPGLPLTTDVTRAQ